MADSFFDRDMSLEAIEKRNKAARDMVQSLCASRNSPNRREWMMSIPAKPDYDPDLVIGAALSDASYLLKQAKAE